MWIDTHCHPFKQYYEDISAVVERAKAKNVTKMIAVAFTPEANREVLSLVDEFPCMYGVLGVHPSECALLTGEELKFMREAAKANKKIVAIGEIGLDYFHNEHTPEEQERTFREQIRLARELDLPCVVHSRDASEDTLRILIDEKAGKVVFHCYAYDLAFAKKLWERGYYTSFTGIITYKKSDELREVVKAVPDDLFFVETDCPYLAPQSVRGQQNEMAYVVEVGEKVAEVRGVSAEEIEQVCERNVRRVFGV